MRNVSPRMTQVRRWKAAVVASLLTILALPWLGSSTAEARIVIAPPKRFTFKIDPATPLPQLLPVAPKLKPAPLPWQVKKVSDAPEIRFSEEPAKPAPVDLDKLDEKERELELSRQFFQPHKDTERLAHQIAKINHLNKTEADRFMRLLMESRPDLQGLPFTLGAACRTDKTFSGLFAQAVTDIHALGAGIRKRSGKRKESEADFFWNFQAHLAQLPDGKPKYADRQDVQAAALMQILGPAPKKLHLELVAHLNQTSTPETTKALAQLAVFSFEEEVRNAALLALKGRPEVDYTLVLKHGLAYPRPEIARNTANAIAKLGRKDLIGFLVEQIDTPEPWAPVERDGKAPVVREVVQLNHHRNCLLCHPPGNTDDLKLDAFGNTSEAAVGAVPVPGQSFPSMGGYRSGASPDTFVRADATYLRQDFSQMRTVTDADPWPAEQRFDYLVRERNVTKEEVNAYSRWLEEQGPLYVSPWRQAIHDSLIALTGRTAPEQTASAWRKALK